MKLSLKGPKAFSINVALLLTTVACVCFLAGLALRVRVYCESQKSFGKLMKNLPQFEKGIARHLGQIIQPSQYPKIIYELRPNMSVNFSGVLVKTNSQGFRNDSFTLVKGNNTVRIIGLGDSHMFGWGVPQDKMYTKVLEGMLNARFPHQNWEVINTAVPGYNTYIEIETLNRKALAYNPDIVIVEYIGNDLDLPDFLIESVNYLSMKWLSAYRIIGLQAR